MQAFNNRPSESEHILSHHVWKHTHSPHVLNISHYLYEYNCRITKPVMNTNEVAALKHRIQEMKIMRGQVDIYLNELKAGHDHITNVPAEDLASLGEEVRDLLSDARRAAKSGLSAQDRTHSIQDLELILLCIDSEISLRETIVKESEMEQEQHLGAELER